MFENFLSKIGMYIPADWLEKTLWPWSIRILGAIAIWFIGKWIVRRIIGIATRLMHRNKLDSMLIQFLARVLYIVLLIALTIAVLDNAGIPTASVLAVFGAAGLAVGLALRDSLANFAAGIMLIVVRPFKIGDYIEVAGVAGTLTDINIFSTTLVTPDNRRIIIPNNQITQGVIVDYDSHDTRRIDLVLGIGYQDDPDRAIALIQRLLDSDPRILKDPAPRIAVSELGESSVNLIIRPWVKRADYWEVRWKLLKDLRNACDEAGISIPFPQRELTVHHISAPAALSGSIER